MNTLQRLETIQKVHELIQSEKSGSSSSISKGLNIPHRTIQRYIQELRDLGANIQYDTARKTYYYMNDFVFRIEIGDRCQ
ncbi:HTH domain-containing protein [Bacteroides sp. 51]|uniref:HTH domain-containing protein n=1 Tax=Bacteroides sp. 51 TaxID=2302938 RepID=UPI0013D24103|nr:HTH domain-containing protein [Bacteroides sp. 51]